MLVIVIMMWRVLIVECCVSFMCLFLVANTRLVKDLVSTIWICVSYCDNVVVCIDWNIAYRFVFGLFLLANAG